MNTEKNVGRLDRRLRHWRAKVDELVSKANDNEAESKVEYQRRVDEFKAKHLAAQLKLAEFKTAGMDKWEQFREEIENLWAGLASAYRELKHQSKPPPA